MCGESVSVCNMACLGLSQHALATFIVDLPVFGRGGRGALGGGGVGLNLGLLTYIQREGLTQCGRHPAVILLYYGQLTHPCKQYILWIRSGSNLKTSSVAVP